MEFAVEDLADQVVYRLMKIRNVDGIISKVRSLLF